MSSINPSAATAGKTFACQMSLVREEAKNLGAELEPHAGDGEPVQAEPAVASPRHACHRRSSNEQVSDCRPSKCVPHIPLQK